MNLLNGFELNFVSLPSKAAKKDILRRGGGKAIKKEKRC